MRWLFVLETNTWNRITLQINAYGKIKQRFKKDATEDWKNLQLRSAVDPFGGCL